MRASLLLLQGRKLRKKRKKEETPPFVKGRKKGGEKGGEGSLEWGGTCGRGRMSLRQH